MKCMYHFILNLETFIFYCFTINVYGIWLHYSNTYWPSLLPNIIYTKRPWSKSEYQTFLQHVLVTVCLTVGIDCCPYGNWDILLNVFGRCMVGIWVSVPIILIEVYCCLPHFLQTRTVGLLKIRPQPFPSLTFPIHYSLMIQTSGVV